MQAETLRRVTPGQTFDLVVTGAPTGLVGTIGVTLYDAYGSVVQDRFVTGIVEDPASVYTAQMTAPNYGPEEAYFAVADTGTLGYLTTAIGFIFVSERAGQTYSVAPGGQVVSALVNVPPPPSGHTPQYQVIDGAGNVIVARNDAVAELVAGIGVWVALFDAPVNADPAVAEDYAVVWDTDYLDAGLTNLNTTADPFTVSGVQPVTYQGGARMPLAVVACGVELANAARLFEYLRNGYQPEGPNVQIQAPGGLPSILYRLGGVPQVFTAPDLDPAPWYDPSFPESADFLGVLIDPGRSTQLEQVIARSQTQRPSGLTGMAIGPRLLAGLPLLFAGTMMAVSDAGMEYGKTWLKNQLVGCDPCGLCDVQLRVVAPPDDGSDDSMGLWQAYETACTDGPHFAEIWSGCHGLLDVNWTLLAGNPWLYKPPVEIMPETILNDEPVGSLDLCTDFCEWWSGPASDLVCASIPSPPFGTNGVVMTIDATAGGVGDVLVQVYKDGDQGTSAQPLSEFRVPYLAEGSLLTIDAATRTITYYAADGSVSDGSPYVVPDSGQSFTWPEVRSCDPDAALCLSVEHPCGGGQLATVRADTRLRAA